MTWNDSGIRNTSITEEFDFNNLFVPDLHIINLIEHRTLQVFEKKRQSLQVLPNGEIRYYLVSSYC
jgi:hypothetical protein